MCCVLTYLFGHSIYFARLRHVNPQCKHKCAFLQMKEAPNQKVQEKKPLLKFKNTNKNMCLERILKNVFGTDPGYPRANCPGPNLPRTDILNWIGYISLGSMRYRVLIMDNKEVNFKYSLMADAATHRYIYC